MDWRPGFDHQFILLTDTFDLRTESTATRIQLECLHGGSLLGRCRHVRAKHPPEAIANNARGNRFCRFQFLLCLILLQTVDIQTPFFDVIHDRSPSQGRPHSIFQSTECWPVRGDEYQTIAAVSRFRPIVLDELLNRVECVGCVVTRIRTLGWKQNQPQ